MGYELLLYKLLTRDNIFFFQSIPEYADKAPNTKTIQTKSHADAAVKPSTLGEADVKLLKIVISTRNRVTNSAILPGITSGSIRKLT